MKVRLGCLLVLVLVIVPPIVAARYLPWWGTLLVVVGELALFVVGGPKLVGWLVKRFLMGLILSKSRVLRSAKAEVHAVRKTERPQNETQFVNENAERTDLLELPGPVDAEAPSAEERDDSNHTYWQVEFTILPKAGASRMALFDPFELMLVPFDTRVSFDSEPTDSPDSGSVEKVFVQEGSAWVSPPDKIDGEPRRLRIVFRCPSSLHGRVKFQYYFETFGDFTLPR